jgi:PP-loop superfamily ATP-utilizing enzyme
LLLKFFFLIFLNLKSSLSNSNGIFECYFCKRILKNSLLDEKKKLSDIENSFYFLEGKNFLDLWKSFGTICEENNLESFFKNDYNYIEQTFLVILTVSNLND